MLKNEEFVLSLYIGTGNEGINESGAACIHVCTRGA